MIIDVYRGRKTTTQQRNQRVWLGKCMYNLYFPSMRAERHYGSVELLVAAKWSICIMKTGK